MAITLGKAATTLADPVGSSSFLGTDQLTGNKLGLNKLADNPLGSVADIGKTKVYKADAPDPNSLRMIDASKYALPAGTVAPQIDQSVGAINMAPQDQFRAQQLQLLSQLSNQAQGVGPSVAGTQLRQGESANLAATMAQLASQRGGFNPLAARGTLQAAQDIQNKTNQQAALLRLQEQQQAQGLLGSVAGAGRGQDIGLAQAQAANNLNVAGQNANLTQNFQNLQQHYLAMGMSADQANQAAALQFQALVTGGQQNNNAAQAAADAQKRAFWGQILNTGGAAGAAFAGKPSAPSSAPIGSTTTGSSTSGQTLPGSTDYGNGSMMS